MILQRNLYQSENWNKLPQKKNYLNIYNVHILQYT